MTEVLEEESLPVPFATSTLGEYGNMLPIGILTEDGQLHKEFTFRELNWDEEDEIDRIRNSKKGPGDHPARLVTSVLAHMLSQWGGNSRFHTAPLDSRIRAIETAFMEDVLYAWVAFRIQELDPVYTVTIKECVSCEREYNWTTDLNDLEVKVAQSVPEHHVFKLSREISHGPSEVDRVSIGCPRWNGVTSIDYNARKKGFATIKRGILMGAIHHVFDHRTPETVHALSPSIRRRIRKVDMERMTAIPDSGLFPRADMTFHMSCPHCQASLETSLDWTWDFFFGSASLSSTATS